MRFNHLKQEKGMGLIEVMFIVAFLALVGLGSATVVKNLISAQRKQNVKANLENIRDNLIDLLQDDDAFANSVLAAGAAPNQIGCMNDDPATQCSTKLPPGYGVREVIPDENFPAAPNPTFNVLDQSNQIYFAALNAASGFDVQGEPCASFNNAGGDDTCPYRWDMTWYSICPNGGTCNKPQVVVHGHFIQNSQSATAQYTVGSGDLSFVVYRGTKRRNEPFRLSFFTDNNPPNPVNDGGGQCNFGNPVVRKLNREVDDYDNVALDPGTSRFTMRRGTYECEVNAQGYNTVGGFSISLLNRTSGERIGVGSAFTDDGTTAYVSGNFTVNIIAPQAEFELEHTCSTTNPPTALSPFNLGIPAAPYGNGSTYTSVSCVRTS